jgi:hypothetical protein
VRIRGTVTIPSGNRRGETANLYAEQHQIGRR